MRERPDEKITENLHSALDQLRTDIDRVELWAGALTGFAKPIPDYNLPFENLTLSDRDPWTGPFVYAPKMGNIRERN